MANKNLTSAKRAKNDEFYTQYADIQKEIEAYLEFDANVFRGKVVYCNCDDPYESNFFRYFVLNFNKLGLKQLILMKQQRNPFMHLRLKKPKRKVNQTVLFAPLGMMPTRANFGRLLKWTQTT